MARFEMKENDKNLYCLYDNKIEQFYKHCCTNNVKNNGDEFIAYANSVSKMPSFEIMALSKLGYDTGEDYLKVLMARYYLEMNPDIRTDSSMPSGTKIRTKRSTKANFDEEGNIVLKKRGRKPKPAATHIVDSDMPKRGRGRPRKIPVA